MKLETKVVAIINQNNNKTKVTCFEARYMCSDSHLTGNIEHHLTRHMVHTRSYDRSLNEQRSIVSIIGTHITENCKTMENPQQKMLCCKMLCGYHADSHKRSTKDPQNF